MNKNIMFILLSVVVLTSCIHSSRELMQCVSKDNQNSIMKWGRYDNKNNRLIEGYIIKPTGYIEEIKDISDTAGVEVAKVTDTLFCPIFPDYAKMMLTNFKLNVLADTTHFIFFENPKTGYINRAVWNNLHDNVGNRNHKIFYLRLEAVKQLNKL